MERGYRAGLRSGGGSGGWRGRGDGGGGDGGGGWRGRGDSGGGDGGGGGGRRGKGDSGGGDGGGGCGQNSWRRQQWRSSGHGGTHGGQNNGGGGGRGWHTRGGGNGGSSGGRETWGVNRGGGGGGYACTVSSTAASGGGNDDTTTALQRSPHTESLARDAMHSSVPPSATVAAAPSSSGGSNKVVPVKRPDKGGVSAIWTAKLRANHFPVRFNADSIIRHYSVDVKLEGQGRAVKISKANLAHIRDKLFTDDPSQFPLSMTAYDGEKNIFSAVFLPTGTFKVEYSEAEDMKQRTYIYNIKLVSELKLRKLKDYLSGNLLPLPRDILQGMDVVMKENPARCMIPVGRSFHPREAFPDDDLGFGVTASRGIQHSLKPTYQGLSLCLDYSVLAFHKRLSVIDYLKEHIPGFNLNDFQRFWRSVENVMKGLKVSVTHRITKQKYVVAGLTPERTCDIYFPAEDPDGNVTQVYLVEYFRQKYRKEIRYKEIPCLDLGKNNRKNYVPMEFCVLVEGQIYPKENLNRDAAVFLKNISLARAKDREYIISQMVRAPDGPCGGDIIRRFGMEVDMNMTSVVGRVLGPPELKLGSPNGRVVKVNVDKEKCHWNLVGKRVVEGISIDRWAVLDFTSGDKFALNCRQFIPKLIARCRNLGIQMEEPCWYERTTMHKFDNIDAISELLERVNDRCRDRCRDQLQILLCVMSRKDPGYKYLKWISETRIGIVTQCCLSKHANEGRDQYLANLALKINAKLGGSNVELMDQLPYFDGEDHVMFIGADVNHPAAKNTTSPSIAAVVSTINWPAANRYAARVRPQYHRSEKILNFGDMCLDLVGSYARLNKVKPAKIVIFRDGVSEGQFDMVLNEELVDLKRAFKTINYTPTITLIVAQKRHQTRLFPMGVRDGSSTGNVAPGTVVDTKIVHPFEFDFYLCSHYGSLGTSKPTHYHVLWDEHNFTSDQLQKFIYNMCFTFARCTKPVSLVPPVYYADLVAYRGRLYHEAVMEGQSPASAASSSSSLATTSSSLSSAASLDDRFYKLHAQLENIMFFV